MSEKHPITREELDVLISVQTKATEHMINVANLLNSLSEEQKEILSKLSNGMKKDIVSDVVNGLSIFIDNVITKHDNTLRDTAKTINTQCASIQNIADDVKHTKWFIGIIGFIIIISTVVLRGLEISRFNSTYLQDKILLKQIYEVIDETENKNLELQK